MGQGQKLSRRDFLKLAGINLVSLAFSNFPEMAGWSDGWPILRINELPASIKEILKLVPGTEIRKNGLIYLQDEDQFSFGQLPLAPTQWNLERSKPVDVLLPNLRWGIVLHWYGDHDYYDKTIRGFLRGFNSIRRIADYETRTSAHFLVGDQTPSMVIDAGEEFFGIAQTQVPSPIGLPYLASHLNNFVIQSFEGNHYFINALHKLGIADSSVNPVLKDLYDGPDIDPNYRTIAVEIVGQDFDNPLKIPSIQKIANTLSVVWALMRRYHIKAIDVLGHNEIQLKNSDPGKKFMALIRFLLGVMALVHNDALMRYLVFSPFLGEGGNPANAVRRYFEYVRDFLVLVGLPEDVFEWESQSKYWFVFDRISGRFAPEIVMHDSHPPILGDSLNSGNWYLDPDNHEGIDLYLAREGKTLVKSTSSAYLVTAGTCVYLGENRGFHHGRTAIFRHRQPDGAQILTLYGHLSALGDLSVGKTYQTGQRLGSISGLEDGTHSFLHFSIAYGATWDKFLRHTPNVPLSANATWVQRHFIHPEVFLHQLPDRSCESIRCLTNGGQILKFPG